MIDEYVHFNDSARNSIMEKMTPDYMVVGIGSKTDQKLFCNEMKDRLNDYYGSRYELRNQSEAVEGRVSNMLSKLQHMYAL